MSGLGYRLWDPMKGYNVGNNWAGGMTQNSGASYNFPMQDYSNNIVSETVLGNNANSKWDYSDMGAQDWLKLGFGASRDALSKVNTKTGWDSIGSMLGGFGDLARGWAAIKGLGLTRDAMNLRQGNWEEEMKLAKTDYNNRAGAANEWIRANDPSGTRQPWKTFNT